MRKRIGRLLIAALVLACITLVPGLSRAADDLVFLHHSCGANWLSNSLHSALLAKDYIDERNDIYYGTDASPDSGRADSLSPYPGDRTDMCHWVRWFNDYLGAVKSHGCATGSNKIVMFKSCYPASNITSDGSGGDPFSTAKTIANYKAVYHHPSGSGNTYTYNSYIYKPLEDIFAENPDTLFIPVTAPPRHYSPSDATNDTEAHRARLFNNWLKNDWLSSYNAAHPGLNNVAVFDWFNILAYADNHSSHPNRLKAEYGGTSGNSHPNSTANSYSTQVFASNPTNFIDQAWDDFSQPGTYTLTVNNGTGDGDYSESDIVPISADPAPSDKLFAIWTGDYSYLADRTQANTTVTMPADDVSVTAAYAWAYVLTVNTGNGDGQYFAGSVVCVDADQAPTGMAFHQWVGDTSCVGDSHVASTTVTMPAQDVEITAWYCPYMLTVNSGSPNCSACPGQVLAILADPAPTGMEFDQWIGDTAYVADTQAASSTITMPTADIEITATYVDIPRLNGDLNGDGWVGQPDLDIVLYQWGRSDGEITDPRADADDSGWVGQPDLDIVLDDWGKNV